MTNVANGCSDASASNGVVSVDNQVFTAGSAFKGELVDVFVDDSVIQVWSKNHLIKTVARARSGPVREGCVPMGCTSNLTPETNRQASGGT